MFTPGVDQKVSLFTHVGLTQPEKNGQSQCATWLSMDTVYFGAHTLARRLRLGRLASPSPHLGSVEGASMLGFAPGGGRLVLAGARSRRVIVVVLTSRTESGKPEPKVLRGLITILAERRRPSRWCKQCPPELVQTLNANTAEVA